MKYYVIGIGGTGAKCVEALTHLCAAGLMPDGELHTVFVDPDTANGSLERAQITLDQYVKCKRLKLGSTDLFKTLITIAKPDVWSPFGKQVKPCLDDFFHYENLRLTNEAAAHLFDVLYSPDEKTTSLKEGFRGHPSIGAAVMATTFQLRGEEEPWETFRNKIQEDVKAGPGAKIVLIGSIFGGTGASGIPTIAKLIREELESAKEEKENGNNGHKKRNAEQSKARLGGVLMLPYFSFAPVKSENLRADSENFLLSTQAALKYYHQQDDFKAYDRVYLLGDQTLSPVKRPSIGGNNQRNEPHLMELYAALACIDFFTRDNAGEYQMVARQSPTEVTWSDLPYPSGWDQVIQKIDQITRFAFAYLSTYYPMLDDINNNGRGYRAPWYVDFFERTGIDLPTAMKEEVLLVKKYCESYLLWLANVQTSSGELKSELINYSAFADDRGPRVQLLAKFKTGDFGNLTFLRPEKDQHALNRLWERVCGAKVKDANAEKVGKFIHALYQECGKK